MDIIDENKYNEIKNILSGCKNIDDAKHIMKLYSRNNSESTKKIALSFLLGKTYEDNININLFYEIVDKINNSNNYDFCLKLIREYFPIDDINNLKLKTLKKILNKKENNIINSSINNKYLHNNLINMNLNYNNKQCKKTKQNEIIKECPHCSKQYIGNENLTHVVCGYNNLHQGFDWEGCTKDWCFSCGKKLCKSWIEDKLCLEINRTHNFDCCKKRATHNCELYDNYCQCNNKYVNRTQKFS